MLPRAHVLELNFIVTSLNDQLAQRFARADTAALAWEFGWMLPLGFVIIPLASHLLANDVLGAYRGRPSGSRR